MDMTATTAMPEAVRTGLARSCGSSTARCSSGTAAMISTSLGALARPYLRDTWRGQGEGEGEAWGGEGDQACWGKRGERSLLVLVLLVLLPAAYKALSSILVNYHNYYYYFE